PRRLPLGARKSSGARPSRRGGARRAGDRRPGRRGRRPGPSVPSAGGPRGWRQSSTRRKTGARSVSGDDQRLSGKKSALGDLFSRERVVGGAVAAEPAEVGPGSLLVVPPSGGSGRRPPEGGTTNKGPRSSEVVHARPCRALPGVVLVAPRLRPAGR